MATVVDVGYLATHLGVPETTLATVTTNPTVALVNAVLSAVIAKSQEYEDLYAQKLQLEVELETNVRGAEAQRDASNETAKKALKDVEEIREKLKQEENTRQALENELQSIRSSSSTSRSELETLKARVESLENSNREKLAIIDTKNAANDTLSQELQAQHQKNLKLSQEVTSLQQSLQNANNATNSAKFKEQSLQQQLDMAQRSADFYENELKTKNAENLKFRKEKGARITELQRINDDATANIQSLKASEQQLRTRLLEAQKKADEGWTKVQQLQETAARNVENFNQELAASNRLVQLSSEHTLTHKNRLQEVETRLEHVKRESEDVIRRLNEELQHEQKQNEDAATQIETLQAEVGRLEAALVGSRGSPGQPGSAPQTPRPLNGSMFGRPGSPFATPSSTRKTVSATQALDEMYRIKGLLAVEQQKTKNLQKDIDEMVDLLESKGPEIDELQSENERLQREIQNMSHMSDESFRERDDAKKLARKAETLLAKEKAEANILRNQVRDLSAQMQMMIFNLEHRDQELTLEETLQFQRIHNASGFTTEDMSDVDALVTQRLVVFKDIKDLQEKNVQLLQVIHDLSEQMKNGDDALAKQQAVDEHKENLRLKEKMKTFQDQLQQIETRAKSVMNERDMFRRLVEERASGDESASAMGRDGVLASIEQNSTMNEDVSDYALLLRELQQNRDAERQEYLTDRKSLREDVEKLSAEKHALQTEVSKVSSQLSLASERYEMLKSNFAALQTENRELQKRNESLSESAARQDIRTQQVAEDLVEARGLLDSMRNEIANLKAEKKLWKDIQERLSKDNENLVQEKSRLNGLLATQQTLQNERDLSEAEAKRRLQAQVDSMESELSATRRKLAEEAEEVKKLQLRKEFDLQQSQKRIDELTSNLSKTREELVSTKTSKDHLQTRVDALTIEVRSAEERAERLQPRPTPRPGSLVSSGQAETQQDTDERIQELIHEVTDVKRDLDLAKTQLENAKAQAEQYKELSQAAEEELAAMNSTQDQYTQEMDAALNSKDATIKELQQRVEDLSSELGRSNAELTTLRDSQAEVEHRFQDEKTILDEEIKRLKAQEENYTALSQFHQQDLRAQAEIATNAQQSYENEVSKHGETAKTLSNLRAEYNQMKTAAATLRAEAESAKATLLQNQGSWDDRRKRFEQELSELRERHDDANAQNKLLHQQLDSVTSQISALQQSRAEASESLDSIAAQPTSTSEDNLREINNYLRREKDILEVQFDLKSREGKRLQEKLDLTQAQLDEARLKLEQERRSQSDAERSSMSHKNLMEKLEELNLFRESSAALRAEARQAQAQVAEKSTKISDLEARIQPLEAQIEELQSQHAFKEAEIKQLQEDRDRWQKRTEDILSKHNRVDPAVVEELQQTVAALETERDALQAAEAPLKEKIEELKNALAEKDANWQSTREKLTAQFKERSRNQTTQIREITADRDRLQNELNESDTRLTSTKEELETEKKERLAAEASIQSFQQQVQSLAEAAQLNTGLNAPVPELSSDSANQQQVVDLEKQLADVKGELEHVSAQKASVEQELENVRVQLGTVTSERDQALANAQSTISNGDVTMENGAGAVMPMPLTDAERKALEDKIVSLEAKATEYEAKAQELEGTLSSKVTARCESMKAKLNKTLTDKKAEYEKEREQMRQEMEKKDSDFKLRMEQERKIWEAENSSAPAEVKPPATPAQQTAAGTPRAPPADPASVLANLGDGEVRNFVLKNTTVLNIIKDNVKNKVTEATKKVKEECEQNHIPKAELEQKIAQAREAAVKMATSKGTLQLNMAENRARAANAKLAVVESAASETPQRPVAEVWAIAKDTKAPPAPSKQPTPANAPVVTPGANAAPNAAAAPAQPSAPSNGAPSQLPKPNMGSSLPKPPSSIPVPGSIANNPFASSQPAAPNPFMGASSVGSNAQPPTGQQQAAHAAPQATQPKSGIPPPKQSGIRQPSGTQSTGVRGARGGAHGRGGRGGGQGRNSMNPGADNFQPGNKRPRGDSEVGGGVGAKRMRGGAGGAQ